MSLAGDGVTKNPDGCAVPDLCYLPIRWLGTLMIETDMTADGTYTGVDLPLIALDSNLLSFSVAGSDPPPLEAASVTLSHGTPVDIEITYWPSGLESFTVAGMDATYLLNDFRFGFDTFASATVSGVPEPIGAWLMLAGIGAVAAGLRFRGESERSAPRL